MHQQPTLNDIARADASPTEAREVLRAVLDEPSDQLLHDTYLALRSWVWKALDQRQRDDDLREWYDILAAVASIMLQEGQAALAQRLDALCELIGESVAVADRLRGFDVTKRKQVTETLAFLGENGGAAARGAIAHHLELNRADLTRVLNLMTMAGLIERSAADGEPVYRRRC